MKKGHKSKLKKIKKYGLNNLFGGDIFFDKEATINEFLNLCDSEIGNYETYDDLYKDAVKNIGYVSFKEKTKDYAPYFYLVSNQDKLFAIAIGIMAYFISKEIDSKGYEIEEAIDKVVRIITGESDYDLNNPFDTKSGKGHRMFGHDPLSFGFSKIPANYLIYVKNDAVPGTRKIVPVSEFLGLEDGVDFVKMTDIIWKFYGNESNIFKGIMNVVGHIIVHFAKDLFTPDGLPIPFTSLLETYEEHKAENAYSVLSYKNSFYKQSNGAHLKGSDFVSIAIIELFVKLYCENQKENKELVEGYKEDVKVIAITTCIIIQISTTMLVNEKATNNMDLPSIADGIKVNIPLLTCYMNIIRKEIVSICKANDKIKTFYKRRENEKIY